jgi:hypothetical protein
MVDESAASGAGIVLRFRRHARTLGFCLAALYIALTQLGCDTQQTHIATESHSANAHPEASPPPAPTQPKHFGLSARAAFLALADTTSSISSAPSPFRFTDIKPGSGVEFVHISGNDNRKLYPTAFGSGTALFDYDGDGRLDIYFATCAAFPIGKARQGRNRLFRNLGGGKFRDVTESSGLGFAGFCHGIIAGDIDNDGDADVFLCNYGPNALFRNNGDGTFRDDSHSAGIDKPNWSTGGAMLDYDGDGYLDIYLANYGDWIYPRDAHRCGNDAIPLFCSPWEIRTRRHVLYHNNKDGTFTDVTDQAGIGRTDGHGFGVVATDLNGDGRTDLYVANDMNPNFLFLNKGDGTFEDVTLTSGAAFDDRGMVQSGMGVDAEDCDGDGRPELFVTNFQNEHIGYYQNLSGSAPTHSGNLPPVVFRETSTLVGLTADSRPWVGWGCALSDFDNDGWPDAFVANGHMDENRRDLAPTMSYPEPPLLFRNVPANRSAQNQMHRRFELSTRDVGSYFVMKHVARGAAFGDIDDDGDIDIVVNHMDAAPAILRNDTPSGNRWIRLRLVGTVSNRDAIGTRVEVDAGGRTITRQRKGGCSMESSNDPRLLIGLGKVTEVRKLTVRWPSGALSIMKHVAPDKTYEVVEPRTATDRSVPARMRTGESGLP